MDVFGSLFPGSSIEKYEGGRIHQGDIKNLARVAKESDDYITKVRPYRKSDGIKHAEDFITTFHDPTIERSWLAEKLGKSSTGDEYSFELWFSDGKLRFMIKTPSKGERAEMTKELNGLYPNAKIYESERHMPKIPHDAYIAGGELSLKKTKYAPIRSFSGPDPFEKEKIEESEQVGTVLIDPYKSILSELIGHQNQAILFQVTFRPAPFDWTDGHGPFDPPAERVSEYLMEGRYVDSYWNPRIIPPTEKDKRTAEHVSDLEESQAFEVNIRFFVTASERRQAERNAEAIENTVTTHYQNGQVAQQLEATRFGHEEVKDELVNAAKRKVESNGTILTKTELAALAHLPNETIEKSKVDFVDSVVGGHAPGSAAQANKDSIEDKGAENTESQCSFKRSLASFLAQLDRAGVV